MKKLLLLLLICSFSFARAQEYNEKAILYITVKTAENQPVRFLDFFLINGKTGDKIPGTTDNKGKMQVNVMQEITYTFQIPGYAEETKIPIPRGRGTVLKTITYDESLATKPTGTGNCDTIRQQFTEIPKMSITEATVKIVLTDIKNQPLTDFPVHLTCPSIMKCFTTKTNNLGEAILLVPINKLYDVGIDNIASYRKIKVTERPGAVFLRKFRYVPTIVNERMENDTIWQEIPDDQTATSSRALVEIIMTDMQNRILPNEIVSLNVLGDSSVYCGKTDANGMIRFLLPKGARYQLNFTYERDIDILDYSELEGIHKTNIEYTYIGTQKINDFNRTVKRDAQGFKTEFMSTPVNKQTVSDLKTTKTPGGYSISIKGGLGGGTPFVTENNLIFGGDNGSHDLFCVNRKTGGFLWGLELGDGGASPGCSEDGILLVNTYSCTLYAIDELAGTLKWSKWLGHIINSTPTVASKKVFTVYPDGDVPEKFANDGNYVLACFGLIDGEILWQRRIKSEVMGAAVYHEGWLYLTTSDGTLGIYNAENGELINEKQLSAYSMPVISGDSVWLTTINPENNAKSISCYSAKNLSCYYTKQIYDDSNPLEKLSGIAGMNADRGRVLHYSGKNYSLMNGRLICSNAATGEVIWSKDMGAGSKSDANKMPILAGGKILVEGDNDQLLVVEPIDGQAIGTIGIPEITGQPVVYGGNVYCSTKDGTVEAQKGTQTNLSGWPMWCGAGNRNTSK
ncbi:MAG: PQQ-binding-like beta-propeller repeat protein [Bacteroidetes bacterium]|nr:PQQ-binding-like beta-propeller repeat protein [Bacteroidota bacterium]MBU1719258.1 PQQ-binding-like beta-propeller repeat protein [Bacteroidota bacterium]